MTPRARRRMAVLSIIVMCTGAAGFVILQSRGGSPESCRRWAAESGDLLARDLATGALPDELPARRAQVASGVEVRRALLREVWAAERVDAEAKTWEEALAAVADDPGYEPYAEARLDLGECIRVEEGSSKVRVRFLGEMEYRVTRGWVGSYRTSYDVRLRRAPDGDAWLLHTVAEERLEG